MMSKVNDVRIMVKNVRSLIQNAILDGYDNNFQRRAINRLKRFINSFMSVMRRNNNRNHVTLHAENSIFFLMVKE